MVERIAAGGGPRAPGVAAAARRAPEPLDALLGGLGERPGRAWAPDGPRCASRSAPSTCPTSSAGSRSWSTSPAPAATSGSSGGHGRASRPRCGRSWPRSRCATRPPRCSSTASTSRRRAARAAGPAARRRGRRAPGARGRARLVAEVATILEDRERRFRELGVDSMATYRHACARPAAAGRRRPVRRRLPRRRRLGDAARGVRGARGDDHRDGRPLADLRRAHRAGHQPLDGPAPGDARRSSAPRPSCASATPSTPRSTASWPPRCPTGPAAGSGRTGPTTSSGCRGSTAGTAPTAWAPASRTWSPGSRRPGPGRPRRRSGCCPPGGARPAALRPAPATSSIGLEGSRLGTVALDQRTDPGLLLIGDQESGKTATLRAIGRQIVETNGDREAKLVVVDYRRSLLGEFDGPNLPGPTSGRARSWTSSSPSSSRHGRLPGPEVTPSSCATAAGGRAPSCTSSSTTTSSSPPRRNPLAPLLPYLAQARDVGLHLYVARRAGGASRALLDPVLGDARARRTRPRPVGGPGGGGAGRRGASVAPAAGPGTHRVARARRPGAAARLAAATAGLRPAGAGGGGGPPLA